MNKKSNKFPPGVRERAVRMVQEHRGKCPSLWATIESLAPKIGCVPQTLNDWVRKHEVDASARQGVTTNERERVIEPPAQTLKAHIDRHPRYVRAQADPKNLAN